MGGRQPSGGIGDGERPAGAAHGTRTVESTEIQVNSGRRMRESGGVRRQSSLARSERWTRVTLPTVTFSH